MQGEREQATAAQRETLERMQAERTGAESDLRDQLEIEFSERFAHAAHTHADAVAVMEKEIKVCIIQ